MNTIEIYTVITKIMVRLKRASIQFRGVLSADQLKDLEVDRGNHILVCNNLPLSDKKEMGHWILLYISPKTCYVFDSYAFKLDSYGERFTRFRKRIKREVIYLNRKQIQSNFSLVCGAYCVYISHVILVYGVRLVQKHIRKYFNNTNKNENDKSVIKLCYQLFGKDMPICTKTFLHNPRQHTFNPCTGGAS